MAVRPKRAMWFAFGLLACALIANTARAQDAERARVDAAIARCAIGETVAGYLAVVDGQASREERAAMDAINQKRRRAYAELARGRDVSIEVVARLAGEKQLANAARGACVMTESGWRRR